MIVEDDTGTCKLMMLDTVAKTIIGCEAIDLWDGSYEEVTYLTYFPILLFPFRQTYLLLIFIYKFYRLKMQIFYPRLFLL